MGNLGNRGRAKADRPIAAFERVNRPPSMVVQVEQALRLAIAEDRFPNGKLPTEVELAEQLCVSRETVRLAAEGLQREGLLVKIRSRGTFTQAPRMAGQLKAVETKLLGYVQTEFVAANGQKEEVANRSISGQMLQGALAEAGREGFQLLVQHTQTKDWRRVVQALSQDRRLRGLICASYDEEKVLRHLVATGMLTILLDQDTNLPGIHTVRDDSVQGACEAIKYLALLGHRRIGYAHWDRIDMNRWRPLGYRKGLRDAGLTRRRQWEIITELTESGARLLIDQFLRLSPPPTALYCFNNTMASFAVTELRRRGVRVPEDVSVVGAGGEEIPGLTCHKLDWYLMGRTAVQILLRAQSDPHSHKKPEHHLIAHTLCIGQTTAGPREKKGDVGEKKGGAAEWHCR